MSRTAARGGRNPPRTWSSFGNLGRRPSEYEIVTHNMNHTYRNDGGQPLELGADVPGNVWLSEHRDSKLFGVTAWNDFRDPDQLTYRKYCQRQDEQETHVDEVLRNFTATKKADSHLHDAALTFLQTIVTPTRYLAHGQQMLCAYLQQVSPSSYVGNCATFQTADALRRVQRIAYRTKQLDMAHPTRGFGRAERSIWEKDAGWQRVRRAIEELLVLYDFDQAFVGYQLCVRPVLDDVVLQQGAIVARSLGSEADALVAESLYVDSLRANRWSAALARFVAQRASDGKASLCALMCRFHDTVDDLIRSGTDLLSRCATSATADAYAAREQTARIAGAASHAAAVAERMRSRVRSNWSAYLDEAGLGGA